MTSVSPKHELQNHRTLPPNPAKNRRQRKQTSSRSDTSASQQKDKQTEREKKHQRQPRTMSHLRRSSRQALPRGTHPGRRCDGTGREESRLGRRRRRAISSPRALARSPIASATARSGPGKGTRACARSLGLGRGGGAAPGGGSSSSDAEAGGLVGWWWWRATRPRHDRRRERKRERRG